MSATSALESNEDLENIPLVRMADIQPDRTSDMYLGGIKKLDSCDVDDDYVYNDEENSNIGSMVSIQPEDVTTVEDDIQTVIPQTLQQKQVPLTIIVQKTQAKQYPDSWPTLEILPGGVIKNADKYEDNSSNLCYNEGDNDDDKMYACAKCPQKFKFLFCLVKHVKWHEDQKKREKISEFKISLPQKKKFICLNTNKKKVISKLKIKCKVPKNS